MRLLTATLLLAARQIISCHALLFEGCRLVHQENNGAERRRRRTQYKVNGSRETTETEEAEAFTYHSTITAHAFNLKDCQVASQMDRSSGSIGDGSMLVELQLRPDLPPFSFQVVQVNDQVLPDDGISGPEMEGDALPTTDRGNSEPVADELPETSSPGTIFRGNRVGPDGSPVEDIGELNVVCDDDGVLTGSANMEGSIFLFNTNSTDPSQIVVTEIPLSSLPPELEPDASFENSTIMEDDSTSQKDGTRRALRAIKAQPEAETKSRELSGTDGTYIDILVPYTQRTVCSIAEVGSNGNCAITSALERLTLQRIQLAIEEANGAFANSGIPGRFRLAHAYLLDESIGKRWDERDYGYETLLTDAAQRNRLPSIQKNREKYNADVVVLFIDNQASCGLAYTGYPIPAQYAYAAVNWVCATGYYSFAHEVAHMMGARHDRLTQDCPGNQCCEREKGCSNYGYIDPGNRFRSIMSYNCPNRNGCPRVQWFSQPNRPMRMNSNTYTIGTSGCDNGSQIKSSWNEVANYRQSNPPAPAPAPSPTTTIDVSIFCGNGSCERRYGEDCKTCPQDCPGGIYRGRICGNGICEVGETCHNCPEDCASRMEGDASMRYCCYGGPTNSLARVSNFGVSCGTYSYCRFNVGCDTRPQVREEYCCGDGQCDNGEGVWRESCPADCSCHNNGVCEPWEDGRCRDCQSDNGDNKRCMSRGRVCQFIFPDPCCNGCNPNTNKCN